MFNDRSAFIHCRNDIRYSVGQVLRHKKFGFRAVVYGWDRRPTVDVSKWDGVQGLDRAGEQPFYHMLPDQEDCAKLFGGPRDMRYVAEDNLEEMESWEKRIVHPLIPHAFESFDPATETFRPDAMLSYQYPDPAYEMRRPSREATAVAEKVSRLAAQIQRAVHSDVEQSAWGHLVGEMFGSQIGARMMTWDTTEGVGGVFDQLHQLRALNSVCEFLTRQRKLKTERAEIQFSLGDVVRHKKFGFRGAVAGWDKRPVVDVQYWDGVVGLPSGPEQPFYHILPDTNDCITAFGAPRGSRYVAQENLETVPHAERLIASGDKLSELFPKYCDETGRFQPALQVAYQYPEDGVEDTQGELPHAVALVEMVTTRLRCGLGEAKNTVVPELLSMLGSAERREDAEVVEDMVFAAWGYHADPALRHALHQGWLMLDDGKPKEALEVFEKVIFADPSWTEALNKRATALYYAKDFDRSYEDTLVVLEREPLHFGALAGQGLCLMQKEDFHGAVESFKKALMVNPWSAPTVVNLKDAIEKLS